jgi:hypothetical protein
MRTFIAGILIALAVTAIGWFGLDAAQISRVDATKDETSIRLNEPQDHNTARPGDEHSSDRP